tara:strand:- start:229 stop:357 length:129 start_codon:yes stop_codon:yes gene_type:complete
MDEQEADWVIPAGPAGVRAAIPGPAEGGVRGEKAGPLDMTVT